MDEELQGVPVEEQEEVVDAPEEAVEEEAPVEEAADEEIAEEEVLPEEEEAEAVA